MKMVSKKVDGRARIVVSTEWALYFIAALGVTIGFTVFWKDVSKSNDQEWIKILLALVIGSFLVTLALNICLTFGVYKKSQLGCTIWYTISLISTLIVALGLILSVGGLFAGTSNLSSVAIYSIGFTYRFLCTKYIGRFRDELKREQKEYAGEVRLAFTHHNSKTEKSKEALAVAKNNIEDNDNDNEKNSVPNTC